MGRGGYVCEGQLTHISIDSAENWTYEMVQCTGPMYNANDYAALNAKLSHDELVKLNAALDRLNATSSATQDVLNKQVQAFNRDLRATIEKRFRDLPNDVLLSPAIQNLKKSLMEYIDQRLPRTPPKNPPDSQSTTPTSGEPGPAPNQP
jgi:ABC-type transporter Mla subunit MlaD